MSIDSGRVAIMPSHVVVSYLHTKSFLLVFKIDAPPPVISPFNSTINHKMIANRSKVKSGSVSSWTDHGRIAVVKQEDGLEAAFWCHELSEKPQR